MRQIDRVIFEAIYYDVVRMPYARRTRVVRQHLQSRCCYKGAFTKIVKFQVCTLQMRDAPVSCLTMERRVILLR